MNDSTCATTFRPWKPDTWPSLYKLIGALLLAPLLHLCSLLSLSSPIFGAGLAVLLAAILVKIGSILQARRQALEVFERGGVPSVANKNPFSGNLFELIVPDDNIKIIDSYHAQLGKTFGMFYGPDPWIFTTDLDLLYRLFVSEGNKYVDIVQFRLPFITEMSTSLAQVQGDEWRRIRRMLDPSFTHRQMNSDNVFADITTACDKLMHCIAQHPLCEPNEGEGAPARILDVLYNSKKYSIEVIFRIAYGKEDGVNWEPEATDELVEAIHAGSKQVRGPVVWTSIMFERSQRLIGFLAKLTAIGRYIRYIHQVLDESLARRRRAASAGQLAQRQRKMIDTIIESVDSHRMDDETLKANLFFIFVAGFETSANTMAILLWLLAGHQRVQDRLRESLAAEGERAQYLDWCIQETLRIYPAVPTAVGRVLGETIQHRGMTLFKGTTVNASIYSIHRSREYWGQDAHLFRPERFGDIAPLHPAQYFAFGLGPRRCLGSSLAMAELRAVVPRILLRYRLERCPGSSERLDAVSPNMIHMIINGKMELKFTEINSL